MLEGLILDNIFYVYEWYNKDTGEVFYVGKGKKNRYKNTTQRNDYFKNYYNKHKKSCRVRIIKNKMTEEQSLLYEKETIAKYREINQVKCNLTEGGDTLPGRRTGIADIRSKFQGLKQAYMNAIEISNSDDELEIERKIRKYHLRADDFRNFDHACEKYEVDIYDDITTEQMNLILEDYYFAKESRQMLNVLMWDGFNINPGWEFMLED
jgi:hypothetical protein